MISEVEQESQKRTATKFQWDWRIVLGTVITALWILTGILYLLGKVGWANFVDLPTGDIGSFLEGAFAPLAFLWLVIGHFMQQSEISANTKAITIQEQSAKRQELHAQRNSYLQLLRLVQQQLGVITSFHYMSICGPTGSGEISVDEFNQLRSESSADHSIFTRKMITLATRFRDDKEKLDELFFSTEIRKRHTENYANTFEKLLRHGEAVDHDDLLLNALKYGSAAGMYYRIVRFAQGKENIDPITGLAATQSDARE